MLKENESDSVRAELQLLADPKYKAFASSLIPGCSCMLGVRIPVLRKIAVRIAKDSPAEYLERAGERDGQQSFEELMLQGLVIGHMKDDIEAVLEQTGRFIPKIDNWSVCDSFCAELKIVRQNRERVWEFLAPYWSSDRTYEVRAAVVLSLDYFISEPMLPELFQRYDAIRQPDHYVKTAVAWAVSMCFARFPAQTMDYLKQTSLDTETFNMAIRKITESLRVGSAEKAAVRKLKRKS